jgi:hypothetical protein
MRVCCVIALYDRLPLHLDSTLDEYDGLNGKFEPLLNVGEHPLYISHFKYSVNRAGVVVVTRQELQFP